MIIAKKELEAFRKAQMSTPHGVLGMHPAKVKGKQGLVVRAFVSDAKSCEVVDIENEALIRYPMERLSEDGFFEGFIEGSDEVFEYRLRVETSDLEIRQFYDPYSLYGTLLETVI